MAPHGDSRGRTNNFSKPPKLSTVDTLKRTVSDISFQLLSQESTKAVTVDAVKDELSTISEVEDAKCECCGMSEECTPEYVDRIRGKYSGKYLCGLCGEAVKEEMEKNGGKRDEALDTHMNACFRFNKFGRAYPVLYQAEAMREILKKNTCLRGKSISPRDQKNGPKIARSSSCIPAITKEMNNLKLDDSN